MCSSIPFFSLFQWRVLVVFLSTPLSPLFGFNHPDPIIKQKSVIDSPTHTFHKNLAVKSIHKYYTAKLVWSKTTFKPIESSNLLRCEGCCCCCCCCGVFCCWVVVVFVKTVLWFGLTTKKRETNEREKKKKEETTTPPPPSLPPPPQKKTKKKN